VQNVLSICLVVLKSAKLNSIGCCYLIAKNILEVNVSVLGYSYKFSSGLSIMLLLVSSSARTVDRNCQFCYDTASNCQICFERHLIQNAAESTVPIQLYFKKRNVISHA
jgi:hypothetical protein